MTLPTDRPTVRPSRRRPAHALVAAALLGSALAAALPRADAAGAPARRVRAADLAAALPTGEQLRPIGSALWYQGTVTVVSGLQPGFPADPQVAAGYLSTVAAGPLTASLSGFTSSADARARAESAARSAAAPSSISTIAGVGDGGWLYRDTTDTGVSCTIRWSTGALIGRLTLRVAAKASPAAERRCSTAGMAALIGIAKGTAGRMADVARGRRSAARIPRELAAVLPASPSGARDLGTIVQSSDARGVDIAQFDAADLSGTDGRVVFRRSQRILGEAGAKQLATSHWAIGDAALVATVGMFQSPESAQTWAHELLGDNPSEETPQHVDLPGVGLGYEVRWGRGTGRKLVATDHVMRISAGRTALDLHCARPFDAEPLGTACSAALEATAKAWLKKAAR